MARLLCPSGAQGRVLSICARRSAPPVLSSLGGGDAGGVDYNERVAICNLSEAEKFHENQSTISVVQCSAQAAACCAALALWQLLRHSPYDLHLPMQAPHPPLKRYYSSEQERTAWVRGIFSRTAGDYERVESAMAFGSGPWYRRRALRRAGLNQGMRVVDVGVGTGLVAREAVAIVGEPRLVTGVDPSPGMLANAKLPSGVRLLSGAAEAIPVADGCADFVSMGYALRHIADLPSAFAEFYRVLPSGGRLCILEITLPRHPIARAMLRAYMRGVVPALAHLVARHSEMPELMRYYWDTIEACVPPQTVIDGIRAAGFVEVSRHVELGIFSEYQARKA
jgi:demethylmenaquinone methyltransferase / 2-methoxy-6-polyprenyl-1,4-benzoquinol methylase